MEEAFCGKMTRLNEEKTRCLLGFWNEMGLDRETRKSRMKVVEQTILETYDAMIREEESHKKAIIRSIDEHAKEQFRLRKELGLPNEDPDTSLSLIELERSLRQMTKRLLEKKAFRMKEVLRLKSEDETLCCSLDMDPFYVSSTTIPSQSRLEGLKDHIKKMSEIKKQRLAIFAETKLAIIQLLEQLESEPNNSFERVVVCEEDDSFRLSATNMEAVKQMCERLEAKLHQNKKLAETLRQRIVSLFEKLQLSSGEREDFIVRHFGHSPSVIAELQKKLKELEELKQQHMEEFIMATRKELEEWWDRCWYSQEQRALFEPFQSMDFTEALLQEHEAEVEKIKSYYEKNKHLFTLVSTRQNLWNKLLELENRAKNPDRFHSGRSTDFLQEEKDRKRVNKQLPKVEADLDEAMEAYKMENGEEFLVGGIPYKTFKERQLIERAQNQENEKIAKANAKKRLLLHETRFGARPVTPIKISVSAKRKAITTPGPESHKRLRQGNTTAVTTTSSSSTARSTSNSITKKTTTNSRQSAMKVKRKILGPKKEASVLAGGILKPKTDLLGSAGSSILSLDFNPFQCSQLNIVNSTFQPTPEASLRPLQPTSTTTTTLTSSVSSTTNTEHRDYVLLR